MYSPQSMKCSLNTPASCTGCSLTLTQKANLTFNTFPWASLASARKGLKKNKHIFWTGALHYLHINSECCKINSSVCKISHAEALRDSCNQTCCRTRGGWNGGKQREKKKIKNLSLFPESTKKMDRIKENCGMLAQKLLYILIGLWNI